MIKSVYLYPGRDVLVFDEEHDLIEPYLGRVEVVGEKVLRDAPQSATFYVKGKRGVSRRVSRDAWRIICQQTVDNIPLTT